MQLCGSRRLGCRHGGYLCGGGAGGGGGDGARPVGQPSPGGTCGAAGVGNRARGIRAAAACGSPGGRSRSAAAAARGGHHHPCGGVHAGRGRCGPGVARPLPHLAPHLTQFHHGGAGGAVAKAHGGAGCARHHHRRAARHLHHLAHRSERQSRGARGPLFGGSGVGRGVLTCGAGGERAGRRAHGDRHHCGQSLGVLHAVCLCPHRRPTAAAAGEGTGGGGGGAHLGGGFLHHRLPPRDRRHRRGARWLPHPSMRCARQRAPLQWRRPLPRRDPGRCRRCHHRGRPGLRKLQGGLLHPVRGDLHGDHHAGRASRAGLPLQPHRVPGRGGAGGA
mmetsp:Transcript_7170/g.21084  ORF Transcript_7170/g.21084 Transcript_7170/m.21084 type:complete len:333 (-) Transcript_7170:1990-2988(-)